MTNTHVTTHSSGWARVEPGLYHFADGANVATTHRMREGISYGGGWMWTTTLNDEWLINADTLTEAKETVARALANRA